MNWAGELAQKEIQENDVVLDLGCGIMQSTLDYPNPGRIQCGELIGVDVWRPYMEYLLLREREAIERGWLKTFLWDLRRLPLPFEDKSVDVILLLDTLEHLENIKQVERILRECDRIGRKKVIVLTPSVFQDNVERTKEIHPYEGLGENPFQAHHVLIRRNWLKTCGFHIREISKGENYFYGVKNLRLRILHVWSQAGVSGLMAKYQRRLGHEVDVIKRDVSFDGLGQDRFYGVDFLDELKPYRDPFPSFSPPGRKRIRRILGKILRKYRSVRFYWTIRRKARNYDVIHIHSLFLTALFIPWKSKIIEFHGDDIRRSPSLKSRPSMWIKRFLLRFMRPFAPFYFSTPDLSEELEGFWIPNPVDIDHFSPERRRKMIPGTALYSWNWYEDKEWAEKIAEEHGWDLKIIYRRNAEWIPYHIFPETLGKFEYYIDRHVIRSLSKTALEALAMGLKVVGWDGRIRSGLDPVHLPENVAQKTIDIYYATLTCGGWPDKW